MSQTVETLFSIFDSSAVVLRKELDVTYLEALVETGDNLFEGAILQEELSESAIERLNREYSTFNEETYKGEEIRKAFQLAILKGMKEGVQANHEMTPDAVGMFMKHFFAVILCLIGVFIWMNNDVEMGKEMASEYELGKVRSGEFQLYTNGEELYTKLFEDIRNAEKYIYIHFYIV
ncbi:hypothetical protein ACT453_14060, partial [Bacillus sp. D-CC]